jgi:hypothetical protein
MNRGIMLMLRDVVRCMMYVSMCGPHSVLGAKVGVLHISAPEF